MRTDPERRLKMMTDQWPQRSDARSAGATARRSETEFDALFMAHYDSVFRQAYRVTGNAQEAEDLTQETFLRLHKVQLDPGRDHNVRAWLLKVVTNLAYNQVRGDNRRDRREDAVFGDQGTAPDPADVAVRNDEQAAVRQVLRQLPERQATLLLLRHAGLSYSELAGALDVAPGSVGTLLARAHAAFASAYREATGGSAGGDDDDH